MILAETVHKFDPKLFSYFSPLDVHMYHVFLDLIYIEGIARENKLAISSVVMGLGWILICKVKRVKLNPQWPNRLGKKFTCYSGEEKWIMWETRLTRFPTNCAILCSEAWFELNVHCVTTHVGFRRKMGLEILKKTKN